MYDDDYFVVTLRQVQYSFKKILDAVKSKNLDAIDFVANQEIKALQHDLEILEGDE